MYFIFFDRPFAFSLCPSLSASRVRSAWLDHMLTLAPVSDAGFVAAGRPLVPLVQSAAARLAHLAGVNRAVHTPTYNLVIAGAAARAAAAGLSAGIAA